MKVETAAWGEIEVEENQIYNFPKGLPGFEDDFKFALLPIEEEPFNYLQSLSKKELSFVVVDPFLVDPKYEFELSDHDKAELEIGESILVQCIVTLNHKAIEQSTVNLLAPIVLNPLAAKGKQVVLHNGDYLVRTPLFNDQEDDKTIAGGEEHAGTVTPQR